KTTRLSWVPTTRVAPSGVKATPFPSYLAEAFSDQVAVSQTLTISPPPEASDLPSLEKAIDAPLAAGFRLLSSFHALSQMLIPPEPWILASHLPSFEIATPSTS